MSLRKRRGMGPRDDRGLALLLTALGMVAMLIIATMVIDVGYGKQFRRQSQATADASALAAAQYLSTKTSPSEHYTDAARIARELSMSNEPELTVAMWSSCDGGNRGLFLDLPGSDAGTGSCVSFRYDPPAEAWFVRVVLPRVRTPRFFGGVVGGDGYEVNAMAQAKWTTGTPGPVGLCGLCGINDGELQVAGGVTITVGGGQIIAADKTNILNQNDLTMPIGYIRDENSNWNGGTGNTTAYRDLTKSPHNYTRVPNPYQGMDTFPPTAGVTVDPSGNATCATFVPNRVYMQKVNISGTCTLTQPGNYYLGQGGLAVPGGARLVAAPGVKVTLVSVCNGYPSRCHGGHTGNVDIDGTVELGEPYFGGFSILFDDTAQGESNKNMNGTVNVKGAIYLANTTWATNGSSRITAASMTFGKNRANFNGGVITITGSAGGGGGGGAGEVSLWR